MKAILTYHSIDDSGSPISVPPATFASHVTWLASGAVRVVSLDAIGEIEGDIDGDMVAVTFDDGFLDTRPAIEQLAANGVPATVFVVTEHIGGTNRWAGREAPGIPTLPLMRWDDLERLSGAGVAIEAHTRRHPDLTTVSASQLEDELAGCRQALRARLGVDAGHLAYPYGQVNPLVEAGATRIFRRAYTTDFRPLDRDDPPGRIPRLDMYYFRHAGALETWGRTSFRARIAGTRFRRRLRTFLPFRT